SPCAVAHREARESLPADGGGLARHRATGADRGACAGAGADALARPRIRSALAGGRRHRPPRALLAGTRLLGGVRPAGAPGRAGPSSAPPALVPARGQLPPAAAVPSNG